jgi:hypothetical protein
LSPEELEEENKQFNILVSSFVKNYPEISTEDNFKRNIQKVKHFFSNNNGSIEMRNAKNEFSLNSIDVLDFWEKVETWNKKIGFAGDDPEKYIFVFLKLDTEDFMVNLKQLERFYENISNRNTTTKQEELKQMLKAVYENLMDMIGKQDPNKSIDIQYRVTVSKVVLH